MLLNSHHKVNLFAMMIFTSVVLGCIIVDMSHQGIILQQRPLNPKMLITIKESVEDAPFTSLIESSISIAAELAEPFDICCYNQLLYLITAFDETSTTIKVISPINGSVLQNITLNFGSQSIFIDNGILYATQHQFTHYGDFAFCNSVRILDLGTLQLLGTLNLLTSDYDMYRAYCNNFFIAGSTKYFSAKYYSSWRMDRYTSYIFINNTDFGAEILSEPKSMIYDGLRLAFIDKSNMIEFFDLDTSEVAFIYRPYDHGYEKTIHSMTFDGNYYWFVIPEDKLLLKVDLLQVLDYDNDGASDAQEIRQYNTNPRSVDTDNDDISDGYEIKYGLDPLNSTDRNLDPDADLLTNYEEYIYGTNPLVADSDHDGLSDSLEITLGTNPTDADSDHDGIIDSLDPRPLILPQWWEVIGVGWFIILPSIIGVILVGRTIHKHNS